MTQILYAPFPLGPNLFIIYIYIYIYIKGWDILYVYVIMYILDMYKKIWIVGFMPNS